MQTKDKLKKENIINAVSKIIVTEGLESVSISKVAKKAGVSKGTIYIYFPNKDSLLFETYIKKRHAYNNYLLHNIDFKETDDKKRLSSFISGIYKFGKKYPEDMLTIDAVVSSHLRAKFFSNGKEPQEMILPWNEIIARGVKNGIFKNINPYGLNFFIFHSISGYLKDLYYGNISAQDLQFDQLKEVILTGIIKQDNYSF